MDDAGSANGSAVQQGSCSSGANQQWQFTATDSGYYRITDRNAASAGQVLDVSGASTSNGAKIQTWQWGGGANQQFKPTPQADGTHTFVARNSGKCLDVTDVSTADGALLQQWDCTGGPAQAFRAVTGSPCLRTELTERRRRPPSDGGRTPRALRSARPVSPDSAPGPAARR
ncbi:RICIN domain-containing protein [Kitasatospora sp. NBC_00315]|uniref:RICIN domain-containing protein n=1 Tax=Kitasatospora sp. NBC_00315 TaxID=2975963 RepID=UPI0032538449